MYISVCFKDHYICFIIYMAFCQHLVTSVLVVLVCLLESWDNLKSWSETFCIAGFPLQTNTSEQRVVDYISWIMWDVILHLQIYSFSNCKIFWVTDGEIICSCYWLVNTLHCLHVCFFQACSLSPMLAILGFLDQQLFWLLLGHNLQVLNKFLMWHERNLTQAS